MSTVKVSNIKDGLTLNKLLRKLQATKFWEKIVPNYKDNTIDILFNSSSDEHIMTVEKIVRRYGAIVEMYNQLEIYTEIVRDRRIDIDTSLEHLKQQLKEKDKTIQDIDKMIQERDKMMQERDKIIIIAILVIIVFILYIFYLLWG